MATLKREGGRDCVRRICELSGLWEVTRGRCIANFVLVETPNSAESGIGPVYDDKRIFRDIPGEAKIGDIK